MRRWCFTLCCLLLFALPFATATATAQETTATVTGTVTDQSGAVLPGVTVSLKHVATGRVSEGVTGAEGGYLISAAPIGTYEATFTLQGFQPRTCAASLLNVNDRVQVDAYARRPAACPKWSRSPAARWCRRRRRCRT